MEELIVMEELKQKAKELLAGSFGIHKPSDDRILQMVQIVAMMGLSQKLGKLLQIDGLAEILRSQLSVVKPKEEATKATG